MKKRWIILGLALAFLLLILVLLLLDRSELYSEPFQKRIVDEVAHQLHWKLESERIQVRLLKGVELFNIRVSSHETRPEAFMTADRLRLKYDRYEALLRRHIILDELRLDAPNIKLDLRPDTAPPPSVIQESEAVPPSPSPDVPASPKPSSPPQQASAIKALPVPKVLPAQPGSTASQPLWPAPQAIDLRRVVIADGILSMLLPNGDPLSLNGANIEASFSADPQPNGMGSIRCENVSLPKGLDLSDSRIRFLWQSDIISIPRMTSNLLGGKMEGTFKADQTKSGVPFEVQLTANDLDAGKVLQVVQKVPPVSLGEIHGKVDTQMHFQGSMLDYPMAGGEGLVKVTGAKLVDIPALILIGGLLGKPEFRNLVVTQCEVEFLLQRGVLQLPRMEAISQEIQLTGNGWLNLLERTGELQMKLALSVPLYERLPPSAQAGWKRRIDGFWETPFRVWGQWDHPENDLQSRFEKMIPQAVGGAVFDKIFNVITPNDKKNKP